MDDWAVVSITWLAGKPPPPPVRHRLPPHNRLQLQQIRWLRHLALLAPNPPCPRHSSCPGAGLLRATARAHRIPRRAHASMRWGQREGATCRSWPIHARYGKAPRRKSRQVSASTPRWRVPPVPLSFRTTASLHRMVHVYTFSLFTVACIRPGPRRAPLICAIRGNITHSQCNRSGSGLGIGRR